jgi:hypothetical protein
MSEPSYQLAGGGGGVVVDAEWLSLEQHIIILKWYWKFENLCKVQRLAAWICYRTSNTINNCTHSWHTWGWWYSAWCAQAQIWDEGIVTGPMYFNMLWISILPAIHQLYGNKPFYFQQDSAPPHYYRHIWSYLDEILPCQRIGQGGCVGYPLCSHDLNPLDFYLWGGPWRIWYIIENQWYWRCYGKKLKHHRPLSNWTSQSQLLVH